MRSVSNTREFFNRTPGRIALILAVGLITYSNTFHIPFHMDGHFITENPFVRDITYPLEELKLINIDYYSLTVNRYAAYLTFALNYKLHGFEIFGYHVVNVSLHLLNALLVYALIVLTFRTPGMARSALKEKRKGLALLSALVFLVHPVQTEAVNWIWQRVTVLAAFFCLASATAYVRARLEDRKAWKRILFHVISVSAAVLAMKTKQNAFTLPIIISVYEFLFFQGSIGKRFARLIPLGLTLLIIPVTYVYFMGFTPEQAATGIKDITSSDVSRADYLLTQLTVLAEYIRLMFFPVNLPVYLAYPLYTSFFDVRVLASFVFLALLFGSTLLVLGRFRSGESDFGLAGFGLIWFFGFHVIESGIIPLTVFIAKYRNYLPSAGLVIAFITGGNLILLKLRNEHQRIVQKAVVLLIAVLMVSTYIRNEVWKTEIGLAQDVVRNSPESAMSHFILGRAYKQKGLIAEAEKEFEIAFELDEQKNAEYTKKFPASEIHGDFKKDTKPLDAESHYNLAVEYYLKKQYDNSLKELQAAAEINPGHAGAHYYIGLIYHEQGIYDYAVREYREAIRLKNDFVEALTNLGGVYAQLGRYDEAVKEIKAALAINPDYPEAHKYLGLIYQDLGKLDDSINEFRTVIRLNPGYAEAHNSLGEVYRQLGRKKEAIAEFQAALRLMPDFAVARNNLEKYHDVR